MEPETKIHCTGEWQHQFNWLTNWPIVETVLSCIVSNNYLAMTGNQTEDFVCDIIVVICSVKISETVLIICNYKFQVFHLSNYLSKPHVYSLTCGSIFRGCSLSVRYYYGISKYIQRDASAHYRVTWLLCGYATMESIWQQK
jgi:hypothetical protein